MPLDLDHIFSYHAPTERNIEQYASIRSAAKQFAGVVVANTPAGADQTAAIRKIREATMTANAAIALEGRLDRTDLIPGLGPVCVHCGLQQALHNHKGSCLGGINHTVVLATKFSAGA